MRHSDQSRQTDGITDIGRIAMAKDGSRLSDQRTRWMKVSTLGFPMTSCAAGPSKNLRPARRLLNSEADVLPRTFFRFRVDGKAFASLFAPIEERFRSHAEWTYVEIETNHCGPLVAPELMAGALISVPMAVETKSPANPPVCQGEFCVARLSKFDQAAGGSDYSAGGDQDANARLVAPADLDKQIGSDGATDESSIGAAYTPGCVSKRLPASAHRRRVQRRATPCRHGWRERRLGLEVIHLEIGRVLVITSSLNDAYEDGASSPR